MHNQPGREKGQVLFRKEKALKEKKRSKTDYLISSERREQSLAS